MHNLLPPTIPTVCFALPSPKRGLGRGAAGACYNFESASFLPPHAPSYRQRANGKLLRTGLLCMLCMCVVASVTRFVHPETAHRPGGPALPSLQLITAAIIMWHRHRAPSSLSLASVAACCRRRRALVCATGTELELVRGTDPAS